MTISKDHQHTKHMVKTKMHHGSADTQSQENGRLLQHVTEQVSNLAINFDTFIQRQDEENKILHKRIELQNDKHDKGIDAIKDVLATRGKVSGQFIITLIAVLLSFSTLLVGLVHSYIGVRLENISPTIRANEASITALERVTIANALDIHRIEVAAAKAEGISEAERRALWRDSDRQDSDRKDDKHDWRQPKHKNQDPQTN